MAMAQVPGAPGNNDATAVIIDSGSTNRAGFRIAVDRSGSIEVRMQPRGAGRAQSQAEPVKKTVPKELAATFYTDLNAAQPFTNLPAAHCAKSVSFGSRLTVTLGDYETPDLSCGDGGNAAMRNLIGVVRQIVALSGAQDMRLQREVR